MQEQSERGTLGTVFDRQMRALTNRPDVASTKATTVRAITSVLELAQTFIVQTFREKDRGDFIFVEYIGTEGSLRLAIPPDVADTIARQRDALTTLNRKRAGRAQAADRKARGIKPGFLKKK